MEGERRSRSRVRKPLSDCTNTIANAKANAASSQSSSSSLLKPPKPLFSSAIKKLLQPIPNTQTNSANSTTASTALQNDDASQQQQPSLLPLPSTPSRLRPPTSGRGDVEALEPCSVYGRRQTSEKRKSKMKATEEPWSDSIMAEKRKSKGKAIAEDVTWRCPLATKIQKIG